MSRKTRRAREAQARKTQEHLSSTRVGIDRKTGKLLQLKDQLASHLFGDVEVASSIRTLVDELAKGLDDAAFPHERAEDGAIVVAPEHLEKVRTAVSKGLTKSFGVEKLTRDAPQGSAEHATMVTAITTRMVRTRAEDPLEAVARAHIRELQALATLMQERGVAPDTLRGSIDALEDWFAQGLLLRSKVDGDERAKVVAELEGMLTTAKRHIAESRAILGLSDEEGPHDVFEESRKRIQDTLQNSGLSVADQKKALLKANDMVEEEKRAADMAPFAGLAHQWTDASFVQQALGVWQRLWRGRANDAEAETALGKWVDRTYAEIVGDSVDAQRNTSWRITMFMGWWAHCAFQKIVTTHTYAAALMSTDATREVMSDLEIQWRAFLVVVPDGLLKVDEEGVAIDFTRIAVTVMSDSHALIAMYDPSAPKHPCRMLTHAGPTLADLLHQDPEAATGPGGLDDPSRPSQRALRLAKRLVAGLLLAMQHQDNFKSRTAPSRASKGNVREEPEHRIVFVGKALKVDCRPAVRAWLATGKSRKGGSAPTVQYIVRGHYKRQVMGVGRSGRRVIWVQPYWKGPEEAPILTRPRLVSGAAKEPRR